jgi:hypothetical protein
MSTNPLIWVAALLTLCIYSFLYKDNPFYKVAEHILVGVSAGYYLVYYWYQSVWPDAVRPLFQGHLMALIPTVLGLLFFFRFAPRFSWLARWSIAWMIGSSSGMAIPAMLQARILRQMHGTIEPILTREAWGAFVQSPGWETTTALIFAPVMVIGVLCTLSYFYFSAEHKGSLGRAAKVGIYFLMIGFGASFGYTVMARISLLIGRIQFLLVDWLGVLK